MSPTPTQFFSGAQSRLEFIPVHKILIIQKTGKLLAEYLRSLKGSRLPGNRIDAIVVRFEGRYYLFRTDIFKMQLKRAFSGDPDKNPMRSFKNIFKLNGKSALPLIKRG